MFDNASKGVEQAQAAEAQSDANLSSALAKNQEIQLQVKDTEKMLRATEGLRLEIMARNEALNADLNRLKSQYQVREQLIADLQARIEEDFERWQTAVNTAVQNRKRDGDLFNDREKDLHEQLQKLKTERKEIEDDMRSMVLMMEDRRADLTKQRETFDQALQEFFLKNI
jgi:predicted  nucleic acid-binding Zn-ribbon protein